MNYCHNRCKPVLAAFLSLLVLIISCQKEKENPQENDPWDSYLWTANISENNLVNFLAHTDNLLILTSSFYEDETSKLVLIALNLDNGKAEWELPLTDMVSSEIRRSENILLVLGNNQEGFPTASALDINTGEQRWRITFPRHSRFFYQGNQVYLLQQIIQSTSNAAFSLTLLDPESGNFSHSIDFDLNNLENQYENPTSNINDILLFEHASTTFLAVSYYANSKNYIDFMETGNPANRWTEELPEMYLFTCYFRKYAEGEIHATALTHISHGHTPGSVDSYGTFRYNVNQRSFSENVYQPDHRETFIEEYNLTIIVFRVYGLSQHQGYRISDKDGNELWHTHILAGNISYAEGLIYESKWPGLALDIFSGDVVCQKFPQVEGMYSPYFFSHVYALPARTNGKPGLVLYANPTNNFFGSQVVCYMACRKSL